MTNEADVERVATPTGRSCNARIWAVLGMPVPVRSRPWLAETALNRKSAPTPTALGDAHMASAVGNSGKVMS